MKQRPQYSQYLEETQLVVRVGLELAITRFQVQRLYHLAVLPSLRVKLSPQDDKADILGVTSLMVVI